MDNDKLVKQVEKLTATVEQLLKTSNDYAGRIAGLEQAMKLTDAYIGDFKRQIAQLEKQLQQSGTGRTLR
ncbi:hypothetical protein [Paracoccus sp. SY]|uniref:hypothetical protein n=1 Tax=Paracoccus sp. SY TaxID=1330255 RepID=UPI000CD2861D|nr:hypothetical protein [Paracoccus sp. SY]